MSLSNLNPLVMPRSFGQQLSQQNNTSGVSPQEWEYIQTMRRTGWDINQQPQNQVVQSDPYIDFANEFQKCSSSVQNRILNDPEFKSAMDECDRKIQSMLEDMVRPQVIQTADGRLAFEKMLAIFRQSREKYSKEEAANLEALQKVMQDEIVQKRIAELNNSQKAGGVQ